MKKILAKNYLPVLLILLLSSVLAVLLLNWGEQQFSYLAKSFLAGRLDITQYPNAWDDAALFNGKYFWPLGPFPALVLAPFVYIAGILGFLFNQKYLQVPLVLATFYLIYNISRKLFYNIPDSTYLAISFIFATCFVGLVIVPWSWYFAQVVAVFLTFLAINEYLAKKRYIFLGLIYACILLTRVTASFGIIWLLLDILLSKSELKNKVKNLTGMLVPYLLSIVLLGFYNLSRFSNFLEQGYTYQILHNGPLLASKYGIFSLAHLPGNLYYFLMASPVPVLRDGLSRVLKFPFVTYDPWGMGILYSSPYFVYLFILKYKDLLSKILWVTTTVIAIPVFLYYGVGIVQFGYRYSLDFLPYLFLILIMNYKNQKGNLSVAFKAIILLSLSFNLYLLSTGKFYFGF